MKKYISTKTIKAATTVLGLLFFMLCVITCTDNNMPGNGQDGNNFGLTFTRSARLADIIENIQLYTFYNNNGAANDQTFHRKALNLVRSTDRVSTRIESGFWHMAMVAPPTGTTLIEPAGGTKMAELPMYKYAPTYNSTLGKHTDAAEIFFVNEKLDEIKANQNHTIATRLDRNVAMVRLIVKKATANFDKNSTAHTLTLGNVPSTISYTGALLPNKDNPTLVSGGIKGLIKLEDSTTDPGFLCADTLVFIIPAHRGSDYDQSNPTDVTTKKLTLSVDLVRTGGSHFEKEDIEIDKVPILNHILDVNITVNDGVLFETSIKEWEVVDLEGTVGAEYTNWLYVKKGFNGTGQSWNDAAPDIATAITRANKLLSAGETVHGILVATGEGSTTYTYEEGLTIPANIRIFGGWEGKSGTELPANDKDAPYKSTVRDLKNKKGRLNLTGSNRIILTTTNSLLDGFIINQATVTSGSLITVGNSTAAINAVEITNNAISVTSTLSMTSGTASNILVADNTSGISITGGAILINATIANNTGASTINNATIYNTAFWRSAINLSGTNDFQNCAFEGTDATIPSGTGNVSLNNTNVAWFTVNNIVPGPHFDANATATAKYYEALNDRCPLIGRGSQTLFDNYITIMPTGFKKDIDGRERHISNSTITTAVTDIGCYEAADSFKGFILEWATDKIYVSYKATYKGQYPLMLPNNDIYDIGVNWTATVSSDFANTSLTDSNGNKVTTISGSGTEVIVGTLNFLNSGNVTPDDDWGGTERRCGDITITTNLGNYLPNTTIEVRQIAGNAVLWNTGYVGSFHRNNEVGARYVSVANSGAWTVRVISGLDWIKIDNKDKNYGTPITDPDEGTPPTGGDTYYREVEQIWNGVISGTGQIKFRVGMQSKNTTGQNRYGLIVITRTAGVSMFFVRQGEDADYLYRSTQQKPSYGARTDIVKFSPYNITDPQGRYAAAGTNLNSRGGAFTKYPSQIGYYFRWNSTTGYLFGTGTVPTGTHASSWNVNNEVCPVGYRHGTHYEWVNTLYYDQQATDVSSNVAPTNALSLRNYAFGAYADGYYDQIAADPIPSSNVINSGTPVSAIGSGTGFANKGVLMVNHYDYGSIFFPAAATLSGSALGNANYSSQGTTAMYYTKSYTNTTRGGSNTHWNPGHIGMNCTKINAHGAAVRCVAE